MTRRMTTMLAVQTVLSERLLTKYRLGQMMQASATSVNQWLSGTKMSAANAQLFKEQFDIEVTDATKTAPARASRKVRSSAE